MPESTLEIPDVIGVKTIDVYISELRSAMIKEAAFLFRERFNCEDEKQAERLRLCAIRLSEKAKEINTGDFNV